MNSHIDLLPSSADNRSTSRYGSFDSLQEYMDTGKLKIAAVNKRRHISELNAEVVGHESLSHKKKPVSQTQKQRKRRNYSRNVKARHSQDPDEHNLPSASQ